MSKKVYIANDHAAVELKQFLIEMFPQFEWINLGTDNFDSVDYPEFAKKVCLKLKEDPLATGVLICGSGQGMSMTANKFKHIRAALCWNEEVAQLARKHNDANVLCLGARLLSPDLAKDILEVFINTEFAGGRHQRRVEKINIVEPS